MTCGHGDQAQHVIAYLMSVRIVENLEIVYIKHQQRLGLPASTRIANSLINDLVEMPAIGDRGQ